jgi:hypothetical protein
MKQISPSFKALRAIIALAAIFSCSLVSAQWYNSSTETAYGATVQAIPNDADGTWNVGSGTYTLFTVTEGVKYRFHTAASPASLDCRITGHKDGESGTPRFYGNTGVIGSYTAVEWVADFTGTLRVSTSRGAGLGWQGGGAGNSHVLKIRSATNVSVTQPVITASAVPASNKIDLNTKESNTTNLRAYYPFEERTGTAVADWGPNNYDGTNTSGSAWGEGIAQTSLPTTGSALSLSGGYAEIPNADSKFNFGTGAFTYEFWMNGSSFAAGNNTYFECGQWSGNCILLRQDNASGIYLYVSGTAVANWSFTPQTGKWYHIALTRSGTTYTIYVNGTVLGTSTNGGSNNVTPAAGTPLRIGSSVHSAGQTFAGRIDEFRVYNVALTDNQIIADGLQGFRMFNLNKNTAATQLKLIKRAEYDASWYYDIDNFENGSDDWSLRDATDPAISTGAVFTGANSLFFSPSGWGRNFENPTVESGQPTTYSTTDFPYLSMAYKIPSGRSINMLVLVNGTWRSFTMTQGDFPTTYTIAGAYPQSSSWKPVYADDAWHYKTINIKEMVGAGVTISAVIFYDGGGLPAISGTFYIDDFVASKYPIYNTNDYADDNSVVNPVIDVAAPTAPAAPTVTVTSSTQLDMSWSGVSDNGTTYYYNAQPHDGLGTVGTAGTTSVLYTKGLDANPYQVNETTGAAGSTDGGYQSALTYSDGGLTANTQYCYQVRARDQAVNSSNAAAPNESAYSSTTCKYTKATCVASFTATTSTSVCGRIDLAWTGGAWTNVRVRCTTTATDIYTGSATSFAHTGLTAGSTYAYEIYVRNGDALEEPVCLTASTTAPALPTLTTAATPAVVTRVCVSASAQTTVLPYTASTGSATSYSIAWTGIAAQGSTAYTFVAGAGSVSGIVVPAGTAVGTYTGTMTYTNALGCSNTKTLTLTVDAYPDLSPAANASPICESSSAVTLTSSVASVWTVSGNGSFGTATSTTTNNFTPALYSGSAQNLTATITLTNGACVNATRTIRVDNRPLAAAGPDQALCNISNFTMAAIDPATGGADPVTGSTGVWSCVGSCGGVTPAPTNTGLTTGVSSATTSTLRWTVTNATCSHSDDVFLTNDQQNFINGNTTLCDAPNATTYTYTSTPSSSVWSFDPSTPGPGVGTITSGGIYNPSDIAAPTATMPVIIRAQNGACTGSISITVYNKPVVSTPSGLAICEGITLNLASDITPANVTWSVTQGPNCTSCLTGTTFVAPDPGGASATYGIDAATGPACNSTVLFQVDQGLSISGFTSNPMPVCDNTTLTGLSSTPAAFWAVTAGGGSLTNVGFPSTANDYTPPSLTAPTQNTSGNIRVTSQNGACVYNFPTRIDNQNTLNTPTTPICESASVVTNAVVGDVNGVTWSIGMGSGLSGSAATANSGNNKNADVTYGSVATPTQNATLTVTATNGVCTAPSVNIQVDNNNSIITTQTPICETGTSFIDGDVDGVVWTASSGSFTSPAQDITLSGVTVVSGQVDVTVTATNGACPPKTTHVFVDDSPNTTSFSTSATSPLCAGGTSAVTITCAALGTGTFTVTYNLSAPNAATGLTASVSLTSGTGTFNTGVLSATGTTTVTLTSIENAAGCSATLTTGNTANVVVNAGPTVAITGHEDVCEGTSITLTATPSGGAGSATNYKWERSSNGGSTWTIVQNTSSDTYPTSSALTPGSYLYKVTLTQSGSNCSAVSSNVSANVVQQPYANDASMQADICKGGSATFTATLTGGGTPTLLYEWVYSDLTSLANGTPTGHTYTNATTTALTIATDNTTGAAGTTSYVLKVYATGTGCNASFSVSNDLNVYADPTVSAPSPAVQSGICAGGSASAISVTAGGGTGSYSYQWYENTTNSNSGGTLIPGAILASYTPAVVAGSRYYYVVVTVVGNGCGAATSATAEVTGSSSTMTASAIVDQCVNVGSLDKYYVLVTATGGTTPYTYPGSVYTSPTYEGVYEVSPGTTVNYTVTDNAGCTATTSNVTTPTGHPTSITLTPSTAGVVTSDCWVSNFNKWVTFRDALTNEAIMAVNDNQNDLGVVAVSVYKEGSAPVILSDQYVNNGGCGGTSTAMRRHFKVTTTVPPTTGVDVALFFSDQEYIDLKNDAFNSNIPYPNPGYECANDDDVYSFAGLYVTKYSGANEDGDYMNNQVGGIYKVYGDNTTPYLPLTKGEYTGSSTGFQSIYGGSQTHHYVQLTVTEFSEFWLHGSSHGEALPVQMIFFQADAINNSYIRLTWATAIEVNNKGFDVERSIDGQTWTKVSFVEGHNNATTQNNYSYNDMDVTAGVVYYYRLKQVDNDGAFEYTDIVTAKLNGETTFSVKDFIPNPTMDKTNLIITAVKDQEISVVFYNIVGQKVLESNTMVNKGANQLEFSLEKLAAGTYTAVVSAANEVYTKKIVLTK